MSSDEVATGRYSYLALLAGGGLGLITGALVFASLVTDWPDVLAVASRYSLLGLGPLVVGSLILGIPAMRFLNRRQVDGLYAALFTAGLSIAIALLVTMVAAVIGIPFGIGLVSLGVPVIWTMVASGALLATLSAKRTVSIIALCLVVAMSAFGAFNIS